MLQLAQSSRDWCVERTTRYYVSTVEQRNDRPAAASVKSAASAVIKSALTRLFFPSGNARAFWYTFFSRLRAAESPASGDLCDRSEILRRSDVIDQPSNRRGRPRRAEPDVTRVAAPAPFGGTSDPGQWSGVRRSEG